MVDKTLFLKRIRMFILVTMLLSPSRVLLAQISAEALLNLLGEQDHISITTGYKTSFVVTRNAKQSDPNQGMLFMDCQATRAEDSFAMKIAYHYEHPPVFAQPGLGDYRPFDYDDKGNLIVWRTLEGYILSAPDRNDTIEKVRVFFIDPNGQIVETGDNTLLRRFPIGSPDNMYLFNQFQLATGTGFSKHLGPITSVKSSPAGLIKVTSKGSYGSAQQGIWELTLDPNSDYLIKKAIFIMDGGDKPTIITTSNGVKEKNRIKMAKYGAFKYSNLLELSVEVTDISKVIGLNLVYEEVCSSFDKPLPKGAEIIDLRGEKPVRTTVK